MTRPFSATIENLLNIQRVIKGDQPNRPFSFIQTIRNNSFLHGYETKKGIIWQNFLQNRPFQILYDLRKYPTHVPSRRRYSEKSWSISSKTFHKIGHILFRLKHHYLKNRLCNINLRSISTFSARSLSENWQVEDCLLPDHWMRRQPAQ